MAVPDDAEGVKDDDEVEDDDAGADDVPDPLLAPSSSPAVLLRLIPGEPPDWPPEDEEPAGPARPVAAADDAVLALGVACWLLAVVDAAGAARLAAEAVQPLWDGLEPAGAYGGWPPGSGGQAPGVDGSGELTPGWFGPSHE